MENLAEALQIAAFGMGIVFAALLGLTGILMLVNRYMPGKKAVEEGMGDGGTLLDTQASLAGPPAESIPAHDDRARAAVAAVAVALALTAGREPQGASLQGAPVSGMSGWRSSNIDLSGQAASDGQRWQGGVWRNSPWQRGS